MRGAIRLALCLLGLPQARADDGRRSRLLVAYVAGRDAVSEKRIGPVLDIWRGMHRRIFANSPRQCCHARSAEWLYWWKAQRSALYVADAASCSTHFARAGSSSSRRWPSSS